MKLIAVLIIMSHLGFSKDGLKDRYERTIKGDYIASPAIA